MDSAPPATRGFSPLDEALGLSADQFSPWLGEAMVRLGAWMPFGQVPAMLAFFSGVRVDAETVRRLTEAAGTVLVEAETELVEQLEREQPAPPAGPAVQQVSADGAMVPLVGGEWAEVKTVAIGRVVVEAGPAERAVHSCDLSYFSRLTDHETFGRLAWGELFRRGTPTAGTVVGVMDGSDWLQGFLDLHRPDAVRVLDFPHAVEHLAAAAQATFGSGTEATATWLETQRHTLRHGHSAAVLAAVRALPTAAASDPDKAETSRAATLAYLEKRWAQIQYAQFAARGYPIGSGMVESANKLVVEARLKGSGMHWGREHVNPMVALRAVSCSQRWDEVWPEVRSRLSRRRRMHQAPTSVLVPCQTDPMRPVRPAKTESALLPADERDAPPSRLPTIVDGKPTRRHPWKRGLLRAAQRTYAKS